MLFIHPPPAPKKMYQRQGIAQEVPEPMPFVIKKPVHPSKHSVLMDNQGFGMEIDPVTAGEGGINPERVETRTRRDGE